MEAVNETATPGCIPEAADENEWIVATTGKQKREVAP